MIAALRDYAMLWRAALAISHRRTNLMLGCMGLVLGATVATLVMLKNGNPVTALAYALRAVYVVLAFGWLMYFVPGAMKLNTPANAILVPRMRRRLRELTVLVWVSAIVLSTLMTIGTPMRVSYVFLGTGFWLAAMALGRSGNFWGKCLLFVLPLFPILHSSIPPDWRALLVTAPVLAVATMLMLALAAYTLETMFPNGGDRHYRLQAEQKLMTDQMSMDGQFRQARTPRLGLWAYQAVLRRDIAGRRDGALLMHVLGPATHWTQRNLSLLALVPGAAIAMFLLRYQSSAATLEMIAEGSWVAASSALLVQLFDYEGRSMRLVHTRGEQSLVRLAPGIPGSAAAFNRKLGWRLLRAALLEWACITAVAVAVVAITGGSNETLWRELFICCLALPLIASNLRDHARRSGSAGWWIALGLAASLGLSFAVAVPLGRMLDTPVLPVAALVSIALGALAVTLRWRRVAGAPHAFPVGRLA
ncbi:hypothetical protein G4G28_05040 [Massilia sp. Dwa41.01b]|uniref:hypothetical protein n=1 Tax=unclassified Massilia TaxID=2609279 RepID=UPI0016041626|nr:MULTISPECIES: hypothetical protein [unclassified Massilia]QNA88004.1 hypothetical protein G4G28_05040 [Massilia sp. Dwa41.01b]QNA98905.1 hypothetical protein G4G31_08755 [Massilia sp. Se16.2.3]